MYWTQLFLQLHVHVWKCITFNNTTLYIYNFTTPPYIHNFTTPPQQSIEIAFRCCNSQQPIVLLQCLLLPDGWWTPFKCLQLTCSPFIKLCCSVKMVHFLCVYVFLLMYSTQDIFALFSSSTLDVTFLHASFALRLASASPPQHRR